jgi:hypothetical protein
MGSTCFLSPAYQACGPISLISCVNILNTYRKNILKEKAATATNKMTGKLRFYPCKSAHLGINGLIDAKKMKNSVKHFVIL